MADSMNENACPLCAVENLSFEAPNCSLCGVQFKQNVKYFTALEGDAKYFFCTACYNKTEGESITVGGLHIYKARLKKTKSNEENLESWVQCDKCNCWQHQICALFNSKRNEEEKAEYICPKCYVQEIEIGQRMPLQESAILGAKDLRRTRLSDFIEGRLFRRLKQEREERAKSMGRNFNEVPGVEDLVLRVVLSSDKKLQVKQNFLDVFKEENYPKEFPYRSKVILLFQKIEGVEVCLFGMYVQEFGSECAHPNQRSIYISYLDSVKFFRPDIRTATGEALRTFVYHEILVGYLDYCKKRGFSRCFIWSCPPSKADDYIFYCHPEIQKTLKPEYLREWYHAMLRKAANEKIVVNVTTIYEHFFVPHGECKVTATRLPYFDGDYFSRAAEDMLKNLVEEDGVKPRRKQKKPKSRRSLECTDFSGTSVTDILLMQELGKSICKTKENFIMVNLESEHMALDTEDKDEIIESKIFDSRETLLRFCETNHYQFDTLRRAKYSSMMLLYHLHNPSA
ncbi:zinc finger protein [Macleaya cordata]|uniref:histone acetyltransferase n=1 Tax=Macleaya cordata TaxID=56857 RepID=A0A200QNJ3_MACCD|nr:zinc finger protein [Macleaya cordata]